MEHRCAACGADTSEHPEYGDGLIRALRHPLPDRRLLAARILGLRRAPARPCRI